MKDPYIVTRSMWDSIKLIDHTGKYYQSVKTSEALNMARLIDLNLVCFKEPENGELSFCKILNFNKWKYAEEKNKKKMAKQNKRDTKELRFTPDICEDDIGHKIRQAKEFLQRGDDVVFCMQMRGRQRIYAEEAEKKLNRIVDTCKDCGKEVSRNKTEKGIIIKMSKSSRIETKGNIDNPLPIPQNIDEVKEINEVKEIL